MYKIYLKEEDMMKDTDFPIIALINEACNTDIVEFILNLSKGIGSGYNYTNCMFWDELDEYDKLTISHYEGLQVSTENGEEVITSKEEVITYLKIASDRLKEEGFPDTDKLRNLIESL